MFFACTECAAKSDFASALFDGDKHDVHDTHATDAECHRANHEEKGFDADGDAFHDGLKFLAAEHGDGALVIRGKMLAVGDGRTELHHGRGFEDWSDGFPDHDAGIFCVPEIVCGSVRNEGGFIVAVEIATVREFHVHGADDGEGNAFDADGFAESWFAAEKFFAKAGAEENDAAAFGDVFGRDPAAVAGDFVAHFAVFGEDAADSGVGETFAIRDALKANGFARDALDERRLRFDPLGVFCFKADGFAGAFAAGLFAGGAGPCDYCAFAEHFEGVHENAAEAGTVAKEKSYSNYSPRDA